MTRLCTLLTIVTCFCIPISGYRHSFTASAPSHDAQGVRGVARGGRAIRRRRYRRHQTPTVRLLAEVRQLVDDLRDREQQPQRTVASVATQTAWVADHPLRPYPEILRQVESLLNPDLMLQQIYLPPLNYPPREQTAYLHAPASDRPYRKFT